MDRGIHAPVHILQGIHALYPCFETAVRPNQWPHRTTGKQHDIHKSFVPMLRELILCILHNYPKPAIPAA
jgi:hypothetical protein